MGSIISGTVALLVGGGLAVGTIVGVVSAQSEDNPAEVEKQAVPYGTNN